MSIGLWPWVIIGGGIQGCTLAIALVKSGKASAEEIAIIDPHPVPLFNWQKNTSRTDMKYLRSPSVHHLDTHAFSLQVYAERLGSKHHLYGKYKRPSLELFNNHCLELFKETNLDKSWMKGRVSKIERYEHGWKISLGSGNYVYSENTVISSGFTEKENWPEWAFEIKRDNKKLISHVFSKEEVQLKEAQRILVIGCGISAAQLAIKLCNQGKHVTILSRHTIRIHDFDSDPGWLGPKLMNSFGKMKDPSQRRESITRARHKGSLPADVASVVRKLSRNGKISIVVDEVERAVAEKDMVHVELQSKSSLQADHIILATGFTSNIEDLDWLMKLKEDENLICAECGFPIVPEDLQWKKSLYVMGALAELEIGPTSRNIAGAKAAAQRIIGSLG
ncbi:SidA/IucD/PvdA family monooxygenase [Bacillus lacus]|uniref:SidA/IucD/PvdA family monooxygenase n=1 Tax=Metabacillus lacus TaxID=1983721 RepID=A0A7X2IYE0_9BACI|nr:FAD/NAD(P)-binding protein [Metabacillus lacus]MRX71939.1 SidA/IucD/PvdA family monooxygenase [Metabacillus lacus]